MTSWKIFVSKNASGFFRKSHTIEKLSRKHFSWDTLIGTLFSYVSLACHSFNRRWSTSKSHIYQVQNIYQILDVIRIIIQDGTHSLGTNRDDVGNTRFFKLWDLNWNDGRSLALHVLHRCCKWTVQRSLVRIKVGIKVKVQGFQSLSWPVQKLWLHIIIMKCIKYRYFQVPFLKASSTSASEHWRR